LLTVSYNLAMLKSDCKVSNYLQHEMRKQLSKTELESAMPASNSGICSTVFLFKRDDGTKECAIGLFDPFRGVDIFIGSCG
jgi:hypothetical protein